MQTLALRWTVWSTVLVVVGVTSFGVLRFLDPPAERTPIDRVHRRAALVEQDEPTVPRLAPEEVAFDAGFSVLWPERLPPQAVLSHADVATGRRVGFRWTHPDIGDDRPFLRLDQVPSSRPLPDRAAVTVRGLPGRLGPTTCIEQPITTRANVAQECLAVWWVEDGISLAVTSPVLSTGDLLQIAGSLRPLDLNRPIPYLVRSVVQIGPRRVSAGRATDLPSPSVTYLSNLRVLLVRSAVGFTALHDQDPRLGDRTVWSAEMQRFHSPRHGETYTWLGRCLMGPCIRGLDRFAVIVERDTVVIETGTRYAQGRQPYWVRPDLYLDPPWR